jgi:hypothetical protein
VRIVKLRGLLLLVSLAACGPTIGDPCTTAQDCLGRTCLNRPGFAGGYCSVSCMLADPNGCPTGSVCIRDGISPGTHGCFRACNTTIDCRSTYVCSKVHGSDVAVCVGPSAF